MASRVAQLNQLSKLLPVPWSTNYSDRSSTEPFLHLEPELLMSNVKHDRMGSPRRNCKQSSHYVVLSGASMPVCRKRCIIAMRPSECNSLNRNRVGILLQLPELEVWFQRATDVVRKLMYGDVDLGIVGACQTLIECLDALYSSTDAAGHGMTTRAVASSEWRVIAIRDRSKSWCPAPHHWISVRQPI